jgi:hypothetical protein
MDSRVPEAQLIQIDVCQNATLFESDDTFSKWNLFLRRNAYHIGVTGCIDWMIDWLHFSSTSTVNLGYKDAAGTSILVSL